ncbi:MAG: hypothetical protein IT494_03295 [Gammaproteobacteria bacterium]|nr:hypothetical protein [Gammaproteobacteria bacterium]
MTLFKINSTTPAFINTYIVETPYDPTLTDAWTIRIENPQTSNGWVEAQTQAIGTVAPVPFATNMRVTGSGTTLQLDWTLTDITRIDSYGMTIWDLSQGNKVVHFASSLGTVATNMTWQIPTSFNNNVDVLTLGHQYAFALEATDRVSGPGSPNLANSSSFFVFTPQATALNAFLPSLDADDVYHFDLEITAPDQVLFFDPEVAIGYDFAIGAGNPNFASVLLPAVGDDIFELWLFDEFDVAYDSGETLTAGVQFDFLALDAAGLEKFRILGIETSAMLDPSDTTAFQAGLTFTNIGSFTGTMTPITTNVVPLPPALLLLGGPMLLLLRRSRQRVVAPSTR